MLDITEERIREVFSENEVSIAEIDVVVDPASHEKWNVIAEINDRRVAVFIWNEESLQRECESLANIQGMERVALSMLNQRLNTSTMLQSLPLQ